MPNLLADVIKDPDGGLYSTRVLGSRGSDCEFDGSLLTNTCIFKSDNTLINLTYWSNTLEVNKTGSSGKIDLGFNKEGYCFHPQLGEIYIKPSVYSSLSNVDIWIEIDYSSVGWVNFNRENILRHWAFDNSYISTSGMGTFQRYFGVFMYRDSTSAYHGFITNSLGEVFMSESLLNLSNPNPRSISYTKIK